MTDHIVEFQKKYGLTPDSHIGKNTAAKMMEVWGINREQFAHLMGNLHNETGDFTVDSENLKYSQAGLLKIFPKYFNATTAFGAQYRPQHIANIVYANRMGNGDYNSNDGWNFRGRGSLQLTGKGNYVAFENWLRENNLWRFGNSTITESPDLVSAEYFWESSLFFFTVNGLWAKAKVVDDATIKLIRKRTNGGIIGLSEVNELTYHYYRLTA